jgi:AMP-activated protein kinase-like protein
VEEHFLHTEGAAGSSPAARTISNKVFGSSRPLWKLRRLEFAVAARLQMENLVKDAQIAQIERDFPTGRFGLRIEYYKLSSPGAPRTWSGENKQRGITMSKKTVKKSTKALSSRAEMSQADEAYPVEQGDLDAQQQRVRNAAAAGAEAIKSVSPPDAHPPLSEPEVPVKPLTTLETLWPTNAAPAREAKPSHEPAQVQKAPGTTSAPRPLPVQSVRITPPEKTTVAALAPRLTSPKTVGVIFALVKPGAKRVSLCGEFNGWSPSATPMKRYDDGHWEANVPLSPGTYQYKFLVDGDWLNDPAAQKNVRNDYGSLNSMIEVQA